MKRFYLPIALFVLALFVTGCTNVNDVAGKRDAATGDASVSSEAEKEALEAEIAAGIEAGSDIEEIGDLGDLADEELLKMQEEAYASENYEPSGESSDSYGGSGVEGKHGVAYEYVWTGNETLYDGQWEFYETDGMVHDGDFEMQRTLTICRYDDSSSIEYMFEYEGDWGEYWHVNYDYAPDATYFDCVEGGSVTLSGNTAVWEAEYGDYREIYVLSSTHEFDK